MAQAAAKVRRGESVRRSANGAGYLGFAAQDARTEARNAERRVDQAGDSGGRRFTQAASEARRRVVRQARRARGPSFGERSRGRSAARNARSRGNGKPELRRGRLGERGGEPDKRGHLGHSLFPRPSPHFFRTPPKRRTRARETAPGGAVTLTLALLIKGEGICPPSPPALARTPLVSHSSLLSPNPASPANRAGCGICRCSPSRTPPRKCPVCRTRYRRHRPRGRGGTACRAGRISPPTPRPSL